MCGQSRTKAGAIPLNLPERIFMKRFHLLALAALAASAPAFADDVDILPYGFVSSVIRSTQSSKTQVVQPRRIGRRSGRGDHRSCRDEIARAGRRRNPRGRAPRPSELRRSRPGPSHARTGAPDRTGRTAGCRDRVCFEVTGTCTTRRPRIKHPTAPSCNDLSNPPSLAPDYPYFWTLERQHVVAGTPFTAQHFAERHRLATRDRRTLIESCCKA